MEKNETTVVDESVKTTIWDLTEMRQMPVWKMRDMIMGMIKKEYRAYTKQVE